METTITKYKRDSIYATIPYGDSNTVVELTEWHNGEGFDINIGDTKIFSLHRDELDMINTLAQNLDLNINKVINE